MLSIRSEKLFCPVRKERVGTKLSFRILNRIYGFALRKHTLRITRETPIEDMSVSTRTYFDDDLVSPPYRTKSDRVKTWNTPFRRYPNRTRVVWSRLIRFRKLKQENLHDLDAE